MLLVLNETIKTLKTENALFENIFILVFYFVAKLVD